ncbi:MAG: FUSC family protein [Parachlamydiales bacterium]
MKLARTTKVALRVSLSLVLSMVIVELFHLPYALWVFFVATSTAAGSLGLSIQRSWQRAVMTVAGSLVGGGLHLLVQEARWADQTLFAIALFFAIYYLPYSYTLFLFFTALLFVATSGLQEALTLYALLMRIVDTLVGAGCALLASLVIFPMRASDLLRTHLAGLITLSQRRLHLLNQAFLTQHPDKEEISAVEEEQRTLFEKAHKALEEKRYERIFGNFFPRNGGLLLTQLDHLANLLRGLTYTVQRRTSLLALQATRPELEAYSELVEREFELPLTFLKTRKKKEMEDTGEIIRRRILISILALPPPDKEHSRQWLNYHTYLHYLVRIEHLVGQLSNNSLSLSSLKDKQ